MKPKNDGLEEQFLFSHGDIWCPCWFLGVIQSKMTGWVPINMVLIIPFTTRILATKMLHVWWVRYHGSKILSEAKVDAHVASIALDP